MNRKHQLKFKNLKLKSNFRFPRPGPSSSILNLRENKNARIRDWILVTLLWASQKTSHHAVFKKKTRSEFFQTQQLNANLNKREQNLPFTFLNILELP